jgi:putative transposase
MARPPRIPVWLQWNQRVIYFVTLCVRNPKEVLAEPKIFAANKRFCCDNPNWNTIAAVVMRDRLHMLVSPKHRREERVTQFSAGLKRFVRPEVPSLWQWQHGVFDRLLRREESAQSKWVYMRDNPVRAGFVTRWEDWPYFIGYTESKTNLPAA